MIQAAGIYENGQVVLLSSIPKKKETAIVIVFEESATTESEWFDFNDI